MKIIVCDDSEKDLTQCIAYFKEYGELYSEIDLELIEFQKGYMAQEYLSRYFDVDIAVLDICLPDITGIQLAKNIRDKGQKCNLIFTTSSKEYALDAFAVDATQYLLKQWIKCDFLKY